MLLCYDTTSTGKRNTIYEGECQTEIEIRSRTQLPNTFQSQYSLDILLSFLLFKIDAFRILFLWPVPVQYLFHCQYNYFHVNEEDIGNLLKFLSIFLLPSLTFFPPSLQYNKEMTIYFFPQGIVILLWISLMVFFSSDKSFKIKQKIHYSHFFHCE